MIRSGDSPPVNQIQVYSTADYEKSYFFTESLPVSEQQYADPESVLPGQNYRVIRGILYEVIEGSPTDEEDR